MGHLGLRRERDRLRERGAAREGRSESAASCRTCARSSSSTRPRRSIPNGSRASPARSRSTTLDEVRERGRGRSPAELEARRAAVRPEDLLTIIYTSGTTGPPKGCMLTHGNYRAMINMISEAGEIGADEVTYLYLPLAHSYGLLIQLAAFDLGSTLAYYGGDTNQIIAELSEVHPTYLPSVPRVFEKIYTLAQSTIDAQSPEEQQRARADIALGARVRNLMNRGEPVPEELAGAVRRSRRAAVSARARDLRRRGPPRDERRRADRPRDPRILLGVRRAGARGLWHDRDRHLRGDLHRREPPLRHGRARAAGRADQDRPRRRDPDQGPEHLRRLLQPRRRLVRDDRGRLAAHRRSRLDRRGRVHHDHRAQEGHHHHRRRQEPHARQHRERPQAVALDLPGGDARRPATLPGRPDHARPRRDRHLRARARPAQGHPLARARASRAGAHPAAKSTMPTPNMHASSRSRSLRSSTTTSPRRPAS